jgi:CubicO group peptidase (beta-lactamase class C family)
MRRCSLCLAVLLASGTLPQPPLQRALDEVGARMKAAVDSGKTPSVVAAVGRDGRIVWAAAFGEADKAGRVPATTTTPYSLASVSKPFTATAVMVLSERGQIGLDEPVTRYVGGLARPGTVAPSEVTVRRTLGHVAGFPLHYQFFFEDRPLAPLAFARTLECYGGQVDEPGNRYVYSNLGFGVLSELVGRAAGRPYAAVLARDVFEPLGLAHARVATRGSPIAGAAVRYGADGEPLPFYVTDHPGASDVFASAEDLVRFGLFHAGALSPSRPVLTAAARATMQQPGLGGYGFGWNINPDWNGRRVVWHSGAMPGVSATLWAVPSDGVAIAVLANQFGAPVNRLAGELLAAVLGVSVPAGGGPAQGEAPGPRQAPVPARDLRGRWVGSLSTCPDATPLTVEIGGPSEVTVTLAGSPVPTQSASASPGRVSGGFSAPGPMGPSTFRFDLRPKGDRLAGTVIRTTNLESRGNVAVTLWAELQRP